MKTVNRYFLMLALAIGANMVLSPAVFAAHIQVGITNFAFTPHGSRLVAGDTITWTNHDAVPHTSTSDNGVWNSGNLSNGQSYTRVFTSTGTFPYHCAVHISMRDTIFVSPQTGIGDQPVSTPKEFELSQNYPNPFNAQTMIKYSLPQNAHVKIEIYNVIGQKIENLADEQQAAGEHQIAWNASNQSSGVFFYRVNVNGDIKTGRMDLLK